MRIGVIGRGFVGGSMERFLKENSHHDVVAYDASEGDMEAGYKRVVEHSDIIYVAVPTPMNDKGECHTGIIESCLELVKKYSIGRIDPLIFIKSTMSPGTSERLRGQFPELVIVTNPEFLTERNAYEDLCRAKFHVLGGLPKRYHRIIRTYHEELWKDCKVVYVSSTEAELTKYLMNSYLAVRVAYANQIYHLSQSLGVDYQQWIDKVISLDSRIGSSHWMVPGPDGDFGFGGKCFPKDLNGLISVFKEQGVDCSILESAWNYNLSVRQDKDWLRIDGATI